MAMEGLLLELMLGEEWLDRATAAVLQRAELQRRLSQCGCDVKERSVNAKEWLASEATPVACLWKR